MTTWVLLVMMFAGNGSMQYAIPNLPTYNECVRVSKEITIANKDSWAYPKFKCIEVNK